MTGETATTQGAEGGGGFRFAPGTLLAERYVVERGLGRGGMGEVYQVRDTALGEVVALKMLSARLASDPAALSRFQGEVRTARQVGHPNVCRTYEFGVHKDERGETAHFLTMELLSGETLASRLTRERLGRPEVLDLLGQVAAAIDAAHAAGIVHRDLKPANVMLVGHSGGGTRAVVTDFGLARQVDESRVTHEGWVGTPAYVAPEQLVGEAGGPAADIYAFGIMLFEAATGRLPFEGATGPQVALQRMARPAPRARTVDPSLPAEWDEAIARCLEKEPAARFTYAGDAVRAMGGEVPGVRTSSSALWSRGAGRRGRAALAGLAVVAIAGAVTLLVVRQRSRTPALPGANRVVAVTVQPAAGTSAPQLPAELPPFDEAAAYVVRDQLRTLEEARRFRVSADRQGNVEARLEWAQRGPAMTGRLTIAPVGGPPVAHFEAEAASIRELAIVLYPRLAEVVGAGQPPLELFPEERAEMERWAAPDARAYQDLKRIILDTYRTNMVDSDDIRVRLEDLIRRHPGWPHAALARVADLSWSSPSARALAASELSRTSPGVDANGRALLARVVEGDAAPAGLMLRSWWKLEDQVIDTVVQRAFGPGAAEEDMRSILVQLADRYPDLQWTGAVPVIVNGRPDWHARAPGNVSAWLTTLAGLALGPGPGPRAQVGWFRALHGDFVGTPMVLAGLHLARFELDEAHALAPAMLSRPALERADGFFILAEEQVFRGRLRGALDSYLRAREIASAHGHDMNFFWTQADRALVQLDLRSGDVAAARDHRALLIADWASYDWPEASLIAFRWEQRRAVTGGCPPLTLDERPGRTAADSREAMRILRRAAAAAGCGGCERILLDGASVNEGTLPWTDVFARCAVEQGRGLDEALRRLSTAERYRPTVITQVPDPSAVDVVLAHYWMARILEKQGKLAEAKAKYDRFLQFWGTADIPIAEVDDAKKRVATLGAGTK